jgi:hypothetical protein
MDATIRSYAFDLQRWFRFLVAIAVQWEEATSIEVADFFIWMKHAKKQNGNQQKGKRDPRVVRNSVTGKPYVGESYSHASLDHNETVLFLFHEHLRSRGKLMFNPVLRGRVGDPNPNAHRSPLRPRCTTDEQYAERTLPCRNCGVRRVGVAGSICKPPAVRGDGHAGRQDERDDQRDSVALGVGQIAACLTGDAVESPPSLAATEVEQRLPEAGQRPAPPAGAAGAALGRQQPRRVPDQFPRHVERGTIGDHAGSSPWTRILW